MDFMSSATARLVGRELDLSRVTDILLEQSSQLTVLTVNGMVGIGKTKFTKRVYQNLIAEDHFHTYAWVTITQKYELRQVLIDLLWGLDSMIEINGRSNEELIYQMYKSLEGKRYLVVLDGMLDVKAWDDLITAFPDDKNGSRIIFTSQFDWVDFHASPNICSYCLHRFSPNESWELLCSNIFDTGSCPLELEPIGNQIASKCKGLPLAIDVVGKHLSKKNKTSEVWKKIEQYVESLVNKELKQCGYILPLRDNRLPKGKMMFDALMSLNQDLELILLSHNRICGSDKDWFCSYSKNDFQNLYDDVTLMNSLLTDSSGEIRDLILTRKLEYRILSATYKAQGCIDSSVIGCRLDRNDEKLTTCGLANQTVNLGLGTITQAISYLNKELEKNSCDPREDSLLKLIQNLHEPIPIGKSSIDMKLIRTAPNGENKLVGLEKDLLTMLDNLTGQSSKLKVFAVIGMAGIGKTTFTKKVYDDHLVNHHFHVRAWVTISQQYQITQVLVGLLSCVTRVVNEINEESIEKLKEKLYKCLKGQKYLIVMDDMWDIKVWDDLKRIFPDDHNGSRIMLTSRLRDVAIHASPNTPPHCLTCLNPEQSWELLSSKIFVNESCPLELVPIGMKIASKCQGLPLAIIVLGGVLSTMNKTLQVWEDIEQKVCSLVMKEKTHCKNILALSYDHLPIQLKLCYLYMGIFPEDYEIPIKKLLWLWIAEGFILPANLKSLEQVAEDYLEDLIARNLVMLERKGSNGRSKTCYIHDLLRDLCITESQNQNFYHVYKGGEVQPPRRICFDSSVPYPIIDSSFSLVHSFLLFTSITMPDELQISSKMNFKILKVLDILCLHLDELPNKIVRLSKLRYLAITLRNFFDGSVFSPKLHNLQILVVDSEWNGHLPNGFWDMLELRHVQMKRSSLSYWPDDHSRPNILELSSGSYQLPQLLGQAMNAERPLNVLHNLQSLCRIRPISCTRDIFLSMPNLRKLGVYENEEDYKFRGWFKYLIFLPELQALKYDFVDPFVSPLFKPERLPSWEFFPPNLMKLTLSGTSFPWEDMMKLSMLPKLEVLKLKNYACSGDKWKTEEGGFSCLKYLLIERTKLQQWEAEGTPFPSLQHLVLMYCRLLKDIPYGICEAPLLDKIELHNCSDTAAISAEKNRQEQEENGNDLLRVHIT